MKNIKLALLAATASLTAATLSGCGGSDNSNIRNFTGFVAKQFNRTSDQTDPVEINRLVLVDRDSENPSAYDPLLSN
jgi:hypothetical protein